MLGNVRAGHGQKAREEGGRDYLLKLLKIRRERTLIDVESMSRRMSVSAVISLLRDRHGEATACKMARLEQLKARRARSRKRFDFWTAVATQMQQGRGNALRRHGRAFSADGSHVVPDQFP